MTPSHPRVTHGYRSRDSAPSKDVVCPLKWTSGECRSISRVTATFLGSSEGFHDCSLTYRQTSRIISSRRGSDPRKPAIISLIAVPRGAPEHPPPAGHHAAQEQRAGDCPKASGFPKKHTNACGCLEKRPRLASSGSDGPDRTAHGRSIPRTSSVASGVSGRTKLRIPVRSMERSS